MGEKGRRDKNRFAGNLTVNTDAMIVRTSCRAEVVIGSDIVRGIILFGINQFSDNFLLILHFLRKIIVSSFALNNEI